MITNQQMLRELLRNLGYRFESEELNDKYVERLFTPDNVRVATAWQFKMNSLWPDTWLGVFEGEPK